MTKTKLVLPRPERKRFQIRTLKTREWVFQPRGDGLQERHVAKLIDALKRGSELDPIAVWLDPESGEYVVADGHHRLAAYERQRWSKAVLVDVYDCDARTAMLIPMRDNAKDRLSLTIDDKHNWAWRMTVNEGWSKAETVRTAGVSDGLVANMRKALKVFTEREETIPETWAAARCIWRNVAMGLWSDDDRDEWLLALVENADRRFGASFAQLCKLSPEAAGDLLERCAGGKLPRILERIGYVATEHAAFASEEYHIFNGQDGEGEPPF